jgi:flavin-dependent thymidylate synthase
MHVILERYDADALTLLLKTKNTRLQFNSDPATWPEEKRAEHLAYMFDTIKSSWEFVDYVFTIKGVTRAFTHQLVRTRTGSYAQEAMRVVDARNHMVDTPVSVSTNDVAAMTWRDCVDEIVRAYSIMIDTCGIPMQDARGILPTNVTTGIMCKFNLRTLHEMAKLRLCTRTQGEYQNVFRRMRELVIEVHPWAAPFLEVHCVATGTCAFPRYGKVECPVYDARMDNTTVRDLARGKFWAIRHEAAPRARDGKAM